MIPGGGQPDMQQLLQQAQKMQQDLAQTEVDGQAGGGLVKATVTGSGELRGLVIDPRAVDPEDPEGTEALADLVVAAVQAANENARQLQQQKLGPLAQGLGGMPGLPF